MKRKKDHEDSSGNVFADLGFRNSKQELLKAKLTIEIYKLLKKRGVTQQQAAKLLGHDAGAGFGVDALQAGFCVGRQADGILECARPGH